MSGMNCANRVTVFAPPSKSFSHRMIMAAALGSGTSLVRNVLYSVDLERTATVLTAAGASITPVEDDTRENGGVDLLVKGLSGCPHGGDMEPVSCDMHESGTSCRLLTAILAAGQGLFRIHGAPRLHERPMSGLIRALRPLGARFHFEERADFLPFILEANGFSTPDKSMPMVEVDASESSQYLSGLLMAAPLQLGMTVIPVGKKVVSWPYVRLTLEVLDLFGIDFCISTLGPDKTWTTVDWRDRNEHVEPGGLRIEVRPGIYRSGEYQVEGDWSNASYFLAAGALGPGPVTVEGLNPVSLQGDRAIFKILERMGARMSIEKQSITALAPENGRLRGIDVDMSQCPDLVPTVAALAATAQGPTRIRNVAHLRIKECDRLAAPARELGELGCRVSEEPDGMLIEPPSVLHAPGRSLCTYGDHRMAMSLTILSRVGINAVLDNPGCVSKSFPGFFKEWEKVRVC